MNGLLRVSVLFTIVALMCLGVTLSQAQTAGDYRTAVSGTWSAISTWQTWNGSAWVAASVAPGLTGHLTEIRAGNTVTVSANVAVDSVIVDSLGALVVNAGIRITAQRGPLSIGLVAVADFDLGRIVVNNGATMTVNGTYEHFRDIGAIPRATWGVGSTLLIDSLAGTTGPTGINGQTLYNLVCNSPQGGTLNLGFQNSASGAGSNEQMNILGDFTVLSTGVGRINLIAPANNGTQAQPKSAAINIAGNLRVLGGEVTTTGSSNLWTRDTLNIGKNLVAIAPGVFNISRGSMSSPGNWYGRAIVNIAGDTLALRCNNQSSLKNPGMGVFRFTRAGSAGHPQILDITGMQNTAGGQQVFEVAPGSYVKTTTFNPANTVGVSGVSFAGGTFDPVAIDGSAFQWGGSAAVLMYSDQTNPQTTNATFWPDTGTVRVGQLVINNPNGVTLNSTHTISGGGGNSCYLKMINGVLHVPAGDTLNIYANAATLPTNPMCYAGDAMFTPPTTGAVLNGASNSISTFVDGPVALIYNRVGAPAWAAGNFYIPMGVGSVGRVVAFDFNQTAATATWYTFNYANAAPPARTLPGNLDGVNSSRYVRLAQRAGGSAFTAGVFRMWYDNEGVVATKPKAIAMDDGAAWINLNGTNAYTPGAQNLVGNIFSLNAFSTLSATGTYFVLATQIISTDTTIVSTMLNGWNLVGLPLTVANTAPGVLFPAAVGSLWGTVPSIYTKADTVKLGQGYWAFYSGAASNSITGQIATSGSATVATGNRWVLVGGLSHSLPTTNLTSTPPGCIVSGTIWGQSGTGALVHPTTLDPMKGYWVFVNAPCTLNIAQ